MKVLVISKSTFQTGVYENVTNIAYNAATSTYTLTYGSGSTFTASSNLYYISVLWG